MVSSEYSAAINKLRVELRGTAELDEVLEEPRLFRVYLTPVTVLVDEKPKFTEGESSKKRRAKTSVPPRKRTKLSLPDGPDAIKQMIQTIAAEEAAKKGIDLDPEVMKALLSVGEDLVDEQLSKAPEVDEEGGESEVSTTVEQDTEADADTGSGDEPSAAETTSPIPAATTTTAIPPATTSSIPSANTTDDPISTITATTTTTTSAPTTSFASTSVKGDQHRLTIHLWKDGFALDDGEIRSDAAVIEQISEGKSVPELQSSGKNSAAQVDVIIEDHGAVYRGDAKQGDKVLCGWCNASMLRVDHDEHEQQCGILSNKRGMLVGNGNARSAKKNLDAQECKQQ